MLNNLHEYNLQEFCLLGLLGVVPSVDFLVFVVPVFNALNYFSTCADTFSVLLANAITVMYYYLPCVNVEAGSFFLIKGNSVHI